MTQGTTEKPIDPVRLNKIFNDLRDLVGDNGSFILSVEVGGGEVVEECELRSYGPTIRLWGLLSVMSQALQDILESRLQERMQFRPPEPD